MKNRVTIYDVAAKAGVSIATVNRALNNKPRVSPATKARILKLVDEMGYRANPAAQSMAGGSIKIGAVFSETIPHFYNSVMAGIQDAFHNLVQYNLEWDVVTVGLEEDAAESGSFADAVTRMADRGCNGLILLLGNFCKGLEGLLAQLYEQNILTATVVTDLKASSRVLSVRSDGALAGRMAAELLSMMCMNKKVAVFTSSDRVDISRENIRGFMQTTQERGLEVVKVYENRDMPQLARRAVDALVREYGAVGGLYITSSNSVEACRRIQELDLSGSLSVVATDVFDELRPFVQDGTVNATLFQDPYRQGYLAVEQLCRKIAAGEREYTEILIKPQIVIGSNLESYMRQEQ